MDEKRIPSLLLNILMTQVDEMMGHRSLLMLLRGLPEGAMQAWPVGRAVGNARQDAPGLIEPLHLLPGTPA